MSLGIAYGYVRVAVNVLLSTGDRTGKSVELGLKALELQALFDELGVEPVAAEPTADANSALAAASRSLALVKGQVPLALWSRLQELRRQL